MKHSKKLYLLSLLPWLSAWQGVFAQMQRFPKPEFQTEYEVPTPVVPAPSSLFMEYLDVFILVAVMCLTTWFIFKQRSRKGILWTSIFSLAYFGFFREGCVCSVGSVQNVALALFGEGYKLPLDVLLFFVLPLLFALAVGRVFCAAACPLGVVQDLVIVKPISVPPWVSKSLGLFPYVYLSLAVLYAATGTDFMICRYDPFVGFFRFGAGFHMIVLGISLLVIGMFVARPYCRFICPYGALLRVGSFLSKNHLSITPSNCINCKLCKDSCPFDAIDFPVDEKENKATRTDFRKFLFYALLIPVLMGAGGFLMSASHNWLAGAHQEVALAELINKHPEWLTHKGNIDVDTFLASGMSLESLNATADAVREQFRMGGWYAGSFIGLVLGLMLLNEVVFRRRDIYKANRSDCMSCGRCMDYCPVGRNQEPKVDGLNGTTDQAGQLVTDEGSQTASEEKK